MRGRERACSAPARHWEALTGAAGSSALAGLGRGSASPRYSILGLTFVFFPDSYISASTLKVRALSPSAGIVNSPVISVPVALPCTTSRSATSIS